MPILSNMRTIINQSLSMRIKAKYFIFVVNFFPPWLQRTGMDFALMLKAFLFNAEKNVNKVKHIFDKVNYRAELLLVKNQNSIWQTVSHWRTRTYAFVCKSLGYITFELSITATPSTTTTTTKTNSTKQNQGTQTFGDKFHQIMIENQQVAEMIDNNFKIKWHSSSTRLQIC